MKCYYSFIQQTHDPGSLLGTRSLKMNNLGTVLRELIVEKPMSFPTAISAVRFVSLGWKLTGHWEYLPPV